MRKTSRGAAVLLTASLCIACLISVVAEARVDSADRKVPTLSLTAQPATSGANVTATGRFPTRIKRPVTLQRSSAGRWVDYAHSRTRANGSYNFRVLVPGGPATGTFRVLAPKFRNGEKRYPKAVTRQRSVSLITAPTQSPPTSTPSGSSSPEPVMITRSASAVPGSVIEVDLAPELSTIESLAPGDPSSTIAVSATSTTLALEVPASEAGGTRVVSGSGFGCDELDCGLPFDYQISLSIGFPAASETPEAFTKPSADRVSDSHVVFGDSRALSDELLVALAPVAQPGSPIDVAHDVAADYAGQVTGGVDDLLLYELRFDSAVALSEARPQLIADARVAHVIDSLVDDVDIADARTVQPAASVEGGDAWWLEQVKAPQAWLESTGTGGPGVGIIDIAQVADHDDLDVVARHGSGSANGGDAWSHGTHVAGLACARGNSLGVVGTSWGCPISSWGSGDDVSWQHLAQLAAEAAGDPAIRVINMSLASLLAESGDNACSTPEQQQANEQLIENQRGLFENVFDSDAGRRIVWVISAGNNCALGTDSPMGAFFDLPNVVTVASTNENGKLSSFSNFGYGVELAASGGVSNDDTTRGPLSTVPCTSWFSQPFCHDYDDSYGTSMASPLVAGAAQLLLTVNADLTASEVGDCLVNSAGTSTGTASQRDEEPTFHRIPRVVFNSPIKILDMPAAIDCARPTPGGVELLVFEAGQCGPEGMQLAAGIHNTGSVNRQVVVRVDGVVRSTVIVTPSGFGGWTGYVSIAPHFMELLVDGQVFRSGTFSNCD